MFNRHSPLKRKHSEFHDPDYPQQNHQAGKDDGKPGCSTNFSNKRRKSDDGSQKKKEAQHENYLCSVRQVIEKEFQREIVMKQRQLEEIDERLEKAKHLLDRLRYGIVLAYYKKQEIPLTAADAASLRGSNCLFDREDKGPQMPLHPSLKKLIGKKPRDLREVMRDCPKRTAAQNAVQTIRAKSDVQKREERKLKQIIRNQGIVIDHSKQSNADNDVNTLINAAVQHHSNRNLITVKQEKSSNDSTSKLSGKSLNSSRLNNKIKYFIVVGNTSKFIGNESEKDVKAQTKALTYKWLVYVQSKETTQPIERLVKKVRFYLHQSYRPNDIIDIEAPPFQVSRRGWGEFPIRVQLFFHPEFHQKPIQLIHNIILDHTLCGVQTLGAETLLEIWLRDIKSTKPFNKEIKVDKREIEIVKTLDIEAKSETNITTCSEELVDDNLLDFLNKIEASPCSISTDVEKIQPTFAVNGPLGVKIKTPSPEKSKSNAPTHQKSPIKMAPLQETLKTTGIPPSTIGNVINNATVTTLQSTTSIAPNKELKIPIFSSGYLPSKPMTTFVRLPSTSAQVKFINNPTTVVTNTQMPPLRPITPVVAHTATPNELSPAIQKATIILNKDGKMLMPSTAIASAVHKTILPIGNSIPTAVSGAITQTSNISIANKPQIVSVASSLPTTITSAPKQILQKKLVQLVDSSGKVKYIQMFVATSSASISANSLGTSAITPKIVTMAPSALKNYTVTNTTQITKTVTTPLLKTPNGEHLVPAMTTKPNIFKIVPESIQLKPQIPTFSTASSETAITNNFITVNTQQKFQNSTSVTAQTVQHPSAGSGTVTPTSNSIALPVTNKLQKSNTNNTMIGTKNLVFQKEGKLYIIDPQQMKYRQQQKKQVSLLKPQVSLLKQQQQKPTTTSSAVAGNSTISTNEPTSALKLSSQNIYQVHFGSKQQRIKSINALQLIQMKRMVFEKQFLRQEFTNTRSAVEYLLRRLKLVVSKDSLVSDFPFVSHTLQEFQSLTAFKQRAYEWLRAKNISNMLRSHKDLQRLNNSSKESFWSTKEIATFARQYAYTPPIKSLPKSGDQCQVGENSSKVFTDLVKDELKLEHNVQYETLTDHYKVRKWVDKLWYTLEKYEHLEDQNQIIDIDGIEEKDCKNNRKVGAISNSTSCHLDNSSINNYLAPPQHLENQCQLVLDMCRDLNIKLNPEEINTNVFHPSTQTVLAQCLHLFIEKVLRQSIAFKQDNSTNSVNESECTLTPQDFVKVFASNSEFDFLTNDNFGSSSLRECIESSVKQEKS